MIYPKKGAQSWIMLFLLTSCISGFEPKLEPDNRKLTVDGLITNQPGPYRIELRYSTPYINDETVFLSVEPDAAVSIVDDLGTEEVLTHKDAGQYETDLNFIGEVGRSYSLNIVLPDGTTYKSNPELLKPVPPIDTIYTSYEEFSGIFLRGEFTVYIDFTDIPGAKDFYRWDWTHYKLEPYCRLSEVEYGTYRATKCCGPCWSIDQCNSCINVLSDNYYEGKRITGIPILKIPYDSKEPYFVQIRLRSLSGSAYLFWRTVSEQISNSGGIFDKPPITIKGNVFNPNDEDEQVLGYFGASSIFEKTIYIPRDHIDKIPFGIINPIYNESIGCIPCEVGPFRTDIEPSGW
jgi:hypothetical protein